MPVNLSKGSSVNLSKEVSGELNKVRVGVGWTSNLDLDSYAVTVDDNGKVVDFNYFSNSRRLRDGIYHHGDDTQGGGRATDPNEEIDIMLKDLRPEVKEVIVGVGIYSGASSLKQVKNTFANIVDMTSGNELARFNLAQDFSNSREVILGKFVANGTRTQWKFSAIGEVSNDRFSAVINRYKPGRTIGSASQSTNESVDSTQEPAPRRGFLGRLFGG